MIFESDTSLEPRDEDCLYLNVYSPHRVGGSMAVLIIIITRKAIIGVAGNLSWGVQCWICQIFPGGRIEAPKAQRRRWGKVWGRGSPPHWGGGGSAPSPENVLVFDLKMVNFGVF